MQIPATRPKAHARLAALAQAQEWTEALRFARAMLKRWPGESATIETAAIAAKHLQQPEESARYYKQLCELNPGMSELLVPYAVSLLEAGRSAEAQALLSRRLALAPRDSHASFNLGRVFEAQGDLAQAAEAYRAATVAQPDLAQAWLNLGVVLHAELDFEGALTALTRAWALWPNSPQVASNLSAALLGLKRADEALQLARFAVSAAPDSDEAGLNLGCALRDLGQIAAAEAEYERVVAMATRLAPRAALNLAALCGERQRGADAVRWLEFMLRLEPNAADGALALGVEYLAQGEMLAGWPLYEHRLNAASGQKLLDVPASLPLWSGESLAGKRVLVVPEQGFGDELQFCRFVPRLRALGASALGLVARQALLRLLPSLAGIDALIPLADLQQAGDWDYWVPMMSLPLRLGVELAQVGSPPYLSPPSDAAARWRSALQRPSIGLVWRGNPNHANDRHRSLPDLNTLAPLAALAGVQWVNLQINATPSELEAAAQLGLPLMDPSAALNDFADTAALISALDLVITVDTAVAHLAGALGRPCWVLLPWIGCDWRWLRDRDDSPWYDSLRLYRQPHEGDWASVIEAVTRDVQRQLLQTPDALG